MIPQIHHHVFIDGSDSWFHMNRIYDTMMQIKTHHFSYFISMFGFNHSARIVNPLYGPFFSYFCGLLLWITGTWVHFEIVMSIIVLIIAGISTYLLGRNNHVNITYSLIMAIFYMLSPVVLLWPFEQSFSGIGAALMPIIMLLGTKMIHKQGMYPIVNSILIAFLFQIHFLTALTSGLVFLIFYILLFIQSNNKFFLIKQLLLTIVIVTLLTANIWGAMINVLIQNNTVPTFPALTMNHQSSFNLLTLTKSYSNGFSILNGAYTFGLGLIICLSFSRWRYNNIIIKLLTIVGIVFAWVSSKWFPWEFLSKYFPFLDYTIQFPRRFLSITIISLLLVGGMLLAHREEWLSSVQKRSWKTFPILVSILFLIPIFADTISFEQGKIRQFDSTYVFDHQNVVSRINDQKDINRLHQSFDNNELDLPLKLIFKPIPDYLPSSSTADVSHHPDKYYKDIHPASKPIYEFCTKNIGYNKQVVYNNKLKITWNSKESKSQYVPVVKYKDTNITFNGKKINPEISNVGAIRIKDRVGHNSLIVSYWTPKWFTILFILTILSWIIVFIYLILNHYGKVKDNLK